MSDLPWGNCTLVMGIVNVTPDSFSGDGLDHDVEAAAGRAAAHLAAGAGVVDLGGESTAYWRPGYQPVSVQEELTRVIPVIERLREQGLGPVSIDTRKPQVADRALTAGASWLNNVEGVWDDGTMARIAAEHDAYYVLMHNRRSEEYLDVAREVRDELAHAADRALAAGVQAGHLVLDPGIGFGKSAAERNLELLRHLSDIASLGFPVLVGPSRKRFLGSIMGTPESDRLEGAIAAVAVAIAHGASAVRVHDVGPVVRAARVADAIVRGGPVPAGSSLIGNS